MERKEIKSLIDWKNKNNRMPLVMKGARQVGKTWLLKTFGQQFYEKIAYINFETSLGMKQVFKNDFIFMPKILEYLGIVIRFYSERTRTNSCSCTIWRHRNESGIIH